MKLILCFALIVIAGLTVDGKGLLPPPLKLSRSYHDSFAECLQYKHHEDGSWSGLACAELLCYDDEIYEYYGEDLSKPYPECCPRCKPRTE